VAEKKTEGFKIAFDSKALAGARLDWLLVR